MKFEKTCHKCGKITLSNDFLFCPKCGSQVDEANDVSISVRSSSVDAILRDAGIKTEAEKKLFLSDLAGGVKPREQATTRDNVGRIDRSKM